MDVCGRDVALLIYLRVCGETAERSFLSSLSPLLSPLLLCVSSCYKSVDRESGKCVVEILGNFVGRNGSADGIDI